jgi:hypothetical protein
MLPAIIPDRTRTRSPTRQPFQQGGRGNGRAVCVEVSMWLLAPPPADKHMPQGERHADDGGPG